MVSSAAWSSASIQAASVAEITHAVTTSTALVGSLKSPRWRISATRPLAMLNTRSAMIHLQRTVVVVLHNVARRIFRIGGCLPHVLLGHMLASSLAVTVVHQLFATVSALPASFRFDR